MELVKLTIDTFETKTEVDFSSFNNHLNYLYEKENNNIIVNGLTYALYGVCEILIKEAKLVFKIEDQLHTLHRYYSLQTSKLDFDDYHEEEAQNKLDALLKMNYPQFLHQHIMPSSFIYHWLQSKDKEESIRSYLSTKQINTNEVPMIQKQINETMWFLILFKDYQETCTYINKNRSYLPIYENELGKMELSLHEKKKKVLREIELVTQLDDMEKEAAIRKQKQETIDMRRIGLNELASLYDEYLLSQDHLFDLEQEYSHAVYLYASENDDYTRLYHHYMNQMAGILAKDLKENTPCPVCGSLNHPHPCKIEGKEVSRNLLSRKETILEKARSNMEKKRLERTKYLEYHQSLIDKIIEKKEELHITEDISKEMFIRELSVLNTDYLSHYKKDKKLIDEIGYLHKLEKHLPVLKQDYQEILLTLQETENEYKELKTKIENAQKHCEEIEKKVPFIKHVDETFIETKKRECLSNQKILSLLQKQTIPQTEDINSFIELWLQYSNKMLIEVTKQNVSLILKDQTLYLQNEPLLHYDPSIISLCTCILSYSLSSITSRSDYLIIDQSLQYKTSPYHASLIEYLSHEDHFHKIYITDAIMTMNYYHHA